MTDDQQTSNERAGGMPPTIVAETTGGGLSGTSSEPMIGEVLCAGPEQEWDKRTGPEIEWPGLDATVTVDPFHIPAAVARHFAPQDEPAVELPPRRRVRRTDRSDVDNRAPIEVPYEPPRGSDGPEWEPRRRRSHPDRDLMDLADRCAQFRTYLVRDLATGKINVDVSVFRPYRLGFNRLVQVWGHGAIGTEWSPLEGAESDEAMRALGRVLGWGWGGDARWGLETIHSGVLCVRRALGWSEASALGRAVIDQYALAFLHREAALTGQAAAEAAAVRDGGPAGAALRRLGITSEALGRSTGDLDVATLDAELADAEQTPPERAEVGRVVREWRRRAARAEVGLRNAGRLVRHASKAGLL